MSPTRLHLHGPPRVTRGDGRTVGIAAREAALLARLHLDGPCPRAALAGLLWPRADEARARANLRQLLLRLRREVGPVLVEADGVLALDGAEVEPDAGDGRLLGPIEFDDAPELADWLAERRDRVRRDRLRDGLAAARSHLQAGRWDAALGCADAVLADDAAVEEAHRVRMAVFLARGDRAAAIGAWDACREALRRAFGIQPSAETNALGRRAMAADAVPAGPAVPGPAAGAPAGAGPLVGREALLARARDALAQGHAVLVTGAAGLGKSRLLQALLDGDATALAVGARPGDEQLPGVLAARLVAAALAGPARALDGAVRRDLAPLLPGAPAPGLPASALDHRRSLAALTALLRHLRAQGVRRIAIDDLQWADALSLEALRPWLGDWLSRPEGALPQPVLAARDGEARPAVQAVLDALAQGGRCVRVEPAPLRPDEIAQLLRALLPAEADTPPPDALAAAVHARVGGNPAFVRDAVQALRPEGLAAWRPGVVLPLPATLVASVRARLAVLPPSSLQLAQLAAVAGTDFSLALASTACGCPPLALAGDFARLEAAGVLAGTGFVHDLVAEAVSDSLPDALRGPLHALVADHLQAHGGAPARVAHHRRAAGDRPAAAAAFQQAGTEARRRWHMADAAEAFEAEARLREVAHERPRRLLAWRDAARCWLNLGEPQRAAAALQAAEPLAVDGRERLLVLAARVTLHLNTGRHAELALDAPTLARTLVAHEAALDDDELSHTLVGVASATPYVDDPQALLDTLQALAPRASSSPRLDTRLALATGMALNWLGWPARAREHLERGDALARRHGLDGERVNLGNQLARSAEGLGDLDAASRRCQQTARLARELGVGALFEADLCNLRGLYEARLGRADRAHAAFDEAARLLGTQGRPGGYMGLREAMGRWWLGEDVAARAAAQAAVATLDPAARGPFTAYACGVMATLAHAGGDDPRPWLDRAGPSCRVDGTLLSLRHRTMRLVCGQPEDAMALQADLAARALLGLAGLVAARTGASAADASGPAEAWCPGPRPGDR